MSFQDLIGTDLYHKDRLGQIRVWRMEVDGENYQTISGVLNGAMTRSEWTTAHAKNIGRSNATTSEEQAILEVAAKYEKRLDLKYHTSLSEIEATGGGFKFYNPMLAQKFAAFPIGGCYSQPKLDGLRMIATKDGFISRGGKPFYLNHLKGSLEPLFQENPDLILDGELYNHEYHNDFNSIVSLVKTQYRSAGQEELCRRMIQYHVYDVPSIQGNFQYRLAFFHPMDIPYIVPVETTICMTEDSLNECYSSYLENGYEGQIVRINAPYEQKRSPYLLKRKEFEDREFELVRVEEGKGNWAGYGKVAICKLPDGREFGATTKGNREFCRQILDEWERYTTVTVRYLNLTPDGIPRFPIAVAWNEEEERLL